MGNGMPEEEPLAVPPARCAPAISGARDKTRSTVSRQQGEQRPTRLSRQPRLAARSLPVLRWLATHSGRRGEAGVRAPGCWAGACETCRERPRDGEGGSSGKTAGRWPVRRRPAHLLLFGPGGPRGLVPGWQCERGTEKRTALGSARPPSWAGLDRPASPARPLRLPGERREPQRPVSHTQTTKVRSESRHPPGPCRRACCRPRQAHTGGSLPRASERVLWGW